ncbi:hypothetical protein GF385_01020 [Candidatus Dependentiae bacterium]|nr:hypothetical protein [Candidatus Dependentiae bacterium]
MPKRFSVKFFIFLFLITTKNIFSGGLLPEAVIEVGEDKCKMLKDLSIGDNVISMDEDEKECLLYDTKVTRLKKRRLTTATLLELKSDDGKKGLLLVARDQKFFKINALSKLRPKLIKNVKQGKKKYLKILLNAIWVSAKNLKVGDKIRGSQYNELEVTKVEYVKFDKKIDFYELSLDKLHTFYVIDSAGHYVLTHNLGFWAAVGIGALIGGIIGGGYAAWISHRNGVLSARTVLMGVVIGGLIGGISAAAVYGGVSLWAKYGPTIIGKISEFIAEHERVKDAVIYFKKHREAIITAFNAAIVFGKKNIREFVEETFRRQAEDIDFSEIDLGL